MFRKITSIWILLFVVTQVMAQMAMPVHFSVKQQQTSPDVVDVIFSATIDKGWHVYSTNLPSTAISEMIISIRRLFIT